MPSDPAAVVIKSLADTVYQVVKTDVWLYVFEQLNIGVRYY